ncbi:MAG TPA: 3-ketoacyl-CoA thiolase [Candidatus Thermoplasmatota archaeon]|nr:3-ketoacyl-CoA thiolase [Candidatus Thermoplasmatota archaeon]
MRDVAIVGGGVTKFGVRAATWKELVQEAGKATFEDVPGLDRKEVDSLFVGAAEPERFAFQSHVAPLAAEQVGVKPWRMIQRVELACASGQAAIRSAWLAVATGLSDVSLVLGVEKMNIPNPAEIQSSMACVLDREWDGVHGASAPPFFALCAQRHMHEYGTTRDDLTQVRVKAGRYAATNPYAHYPKAFDKAKIESSVEIAPPLRLLDCSGITDGAAGVIVTTAERARRLTDRPMYVWGGAQAVEGHNLASFPSYTTWEAARRASKEAHALTGTSPRDVDVAQIHDCFTISEIILTEDLGFAEKGKGAAFIRDGQTMVGGEVAVNTDGGLLGRGHPIGATGVAQAVELVRQFQGKVPRERQVEEPRVALAHNLSGSANAHSILIYGDAPRGGLT